MARGRSEERRQHWERVVGDQESSGLTVAEFCRRRDISPASFYAWRRKVSGTSPTVHRSPSSSQAAPLFVPLPLADSSSEGAHFEVKFPNGISVNVPPRFEVSPLASLLQAVMLCEIEHA